MVTMSAGPRSLDELLAAYAVDAKLVVRANFVSTLDGHATGGDGRSGTINSPADKQVFDVLRALADVVVVGAGTIRAEGYGRLRTRDPDLIAVRRAAGRPDHPTLSVVTASGDLPDTVLADDPAGGPLLVLCPATVASRLGQRVDPRCVVEAGAETVEPGVAVDALRQRGLGHILTEGGPQLLGGWLQAGVVDELCLTIRPLVVGGSGPRIVEAPAGGLAALAHFDLRHALEIEGDLMLRYVTAPA